MANEKVAVFMERFGPMVYRRALSILRDPEDARDAAQEVFLKLINSEFALRDEASSWFYRVTTNLCLNRLRARRRERGFLSRSGHHANDSGAPLELAQSLRELLATADARCATAALFVHVEELSYDEAAARLGISRRTLASLLARFGDWARGRLAAS
jgi:RNA polymerase sigma-70 factor (ECF subfamily)